MLKTRDKFFGVRGQGTGRLYHNSTATGGGVGRDNSVRVGWSGGNVGMEVWRHGSKGVWGYKMVIGDR